MFGDLNKDAGVKALNAHLADNSYIEGFVPSQADAAVFDALKGKCPDRAACPHAERWFLHIKSFEDARKQFAKSKKPADSYLSGGAAPAKEEEDDEDVDLFGSDSEDEEAKAEKERVTAERLKAYHEKKAKKPALIAKTSVLLDIKPWDDETDMDEMLKCAKSITKEGLVWGASKLVPVGYGINKLQLMCVVEDDKVSIDELSEQIAEFEDFVQSVDIAAMSKI